MKKLQTAILALLIFACNNKEKKVVPDMLTKEEMPAALQSLWERTALFPDSTGIRLQLVNALDSLGATKQAMVQMDTLLLNDSLNYGLWYRKALLQEAIKDTSGALRSYRYAIRIYPSPDAMLGAANLLAEKKDSTALSICKQISLMRIGREYEAHSQFISGIYYARTGKKEKAIAAFNNTIANQLNYPEAYMEKGFLLFEDKKIAEALAVFKVLITLKNTYADGYYWVAKCEESLENKKEAIVYYEKALQLDPTISEATDALKRLGNK